jgi:hypothetical protein
MPIPIQCSCGFRGSARDDAAGKALKCPTCGSRIAIPAPVGAAKTPGPYMNYPTSKRPPAEGKEVKVALSPGIKILIGLAIAIPAVIIWAKLGPMAAMAKLDDLYDPLDSAIRDTVNRSLQARHEKLGYKMDKPREIPQVKNVVIDKPVMPFRMPNHVDFQGTSTEGKYWGSYYVGTKKIKAKIEDGYNGDLQVESTTIDGNTTIDSSTP